MLKFKSGDRVKVISKDYSSSGRIYNGRVGIIIHGNETTSYYASHGLTNYYLLDIDVEKRGIWEAELILETDYKPKQYGIVKFLEGIK